MQLLDADGKELDSWTSGEAPHVVTANKGTAQGNAKYTLHEEAAPEGYKEAWFFFSYILPCNLLSKLP